MIGKADKIVSQFKKTMAALEKHVGKCDAEMQVSTDIIRENQVRINRLKSERQTADRYQEGIKKLLGE